MYRLISWYNQNTRRFWVIVITSIFAFIIIRLLMNFSVNRNKNRKIEQITQVNTDNLNSITLESDRSAVTGNRTTIDQSGIEAIDKFVSFCNSGNIQEAYNLLSNECKEQLYNDQNSFKQLYYGPVFGNGNRNVSIENWNLNIYKVDFNEDALSTGRYSVENSLQDYITIVNDKEGNKKLNINGYIGRTYYEDKNIIQHKLEIKLMRKDSYMDYEIYTFDVKNDSENKVYLGNVQDYENVSYLIDKNEVKYNACVYEIPQTLLEVYGKQTKTIQIKYLNEYSSNRKIDKLVFPKIYLTYEDNSNGYVTISFDL